jgi:hypothetical protein
MLIVAYIDAFKLLILFLSLLVNCFLRLITLIIILSLAIDKAIDNNNTTIPLPLLIVALDSIEANNISLSALLLLLTPFLL